MAVIAEMDDKVTYPVDALFGGASEKVIMKKVAIAAADEDLSEYLVGEIPGEAKITAVEVLNEAITDGTDYDLGFYLEDGTVVSKDKLFDGVDMSSARTSWTSMVLDYGADDVEKTVAELLGHVNSVVPASGETAAKRVYRIGLLGNTVGSAAGSVCILIRYRDSI